MQLVRPERKEKNHWANRKGLSEILLKTAPINQGIFDRKSALDFKLHCGNPGRKALKRPKSHARIQFAYERINFDEQRYHWKTKPMDLH